MSQLGAIKNRPWGRFFKNLSRLGGSSFAQRLDVRVQAALVTSGFVLVDDAFVSHTVNDRNSCGEGGLGKLEILGSNSLDHVLDVGTNHRAQAGVMATALLSLFGAFFGRRCIGHRRAPRENWGIANK